MKEEPRLWEEKVHKKETIFAENGQ
ncbi:hypothetical protein TIFTF001_055858, partial [Ficus carica]